MRVALLGGTFDPVHRGHIAIARAAIERLGAGMVWLVPCWIPPHKARPDMTDPYRRFAMTALAATGDGQLLASPAELLRGGVSYTIDTVEDLARQGVRRPFLLLGSDSLAEIRTWRRWQDILGACELGVLERPGVPVQSALDSVPPKHRAGVHILESPPLSVSSTAVRRHVSAGEEIETLVPSLVAAFIRDQGLYRPGTG